MYISNDRSDWAAQIIKNIQPSASSILELGCHDGATLKGLFDSSLLSVEKINGVDYADVPEKLIPEDNFTVCDLNVGFNDLTSIVYSSDVILLLDVLEHLYSPEEFLLNLKKAKNEHAIIIISLPNFSSIRMLKAWLLGDFPRMDIGFFDRTHRSWYSLKNISTITSTNYSILGKGYILSNKSWYRLLQNILPSRLSSQLYIVIK